MPQFVKYTKEFHELIKKTNQLVNKTDITGEEGGSNGRKTTIVEETASGTGVYEYDGMFCIRLVKKTEKEINPDTGEEEDVENTYVCVTDGRSQDPFSTTSGETRAAGFAYVNGLVYEVNKVALKINHEIIRDRYTRYVILLKYTFPHLEYSETVNNEEISYPSEDESLVCVVQEMSATSKIPAFDKYHSYHLLGRIVQQANQKLVVKQDSYGCPVMNFYIMLTTPDMASF